MAIPCQNPRRSCQVLPFTVGFISRLNHHEDVYSDTIDILGSKWSLVAYVDRKEKDDPINFNLDIYCNRYEKNKFWYCRAELRLRVMTANMVVKHHFDHLKRVCKAESVVSFKSEEHLKKVLRDDQIHLCVEIRVHEYEMMCDFSKKDPKMSDVVLIVEGNRLHVNKQLLALQSPYFHTLFFSRSTNGGSETDEEEEIKINDARYKTFVLFLNICYSRLATIDNDDIEPLLQMAERFDQKRVKNDCEVYLATSADIKITDKLNLAAKYGLYNLQRHCVDNLTTETLIKEICSQMSPHLQQLLMEKCAELSRLNCE